MSYTLLPLALTLFTGAILFANYFRYLRPREGTLEWISRAVERPRFRFELRHHPLTRRDAAPLAIILAVFTFISFWKLGDFTAPQTFLRFDNKQTSVKILLPEGTRVGRVMFYTGLGVGNYHLEYSLDGETWLEQPSLAPERHKTAMVQTHADLFKWRTADMTPDDADPLRFEPGYTARYLQITLADVENFKSFIELGELAIIDVDGNLVVPIGGPQVLFDEQDIVPERQTYMNSMYFDEIYHGRAAYETIRMVYPYETVHPPLGKTIIAIGVSIFHMTPFGWRVMGTLFGIGMLAALYILLKNMFGKTSVAVLGTLLLGFDFMRYTQTRIATVDTFPVFFIIMAYLFMYRFIAARGDAPWCANMWPLFLSGLFFGIGVATKWIVIYAGVGLFVLYLLKLITDFHYYYADGAPGIYSRRVIKTLAATALFFIVIPVAIYILSYIPYGHARGMTVRGGMLWNPTYYKMVWNVQLNTFRYHSALTATHPYSSNWIQWIFDARPILYYTDTPSAGMKSTFMAFTNPLITWFGLAAIVVLTLQLIPLRIKSRYDFSSLRYRFSIVRRDFGQADALALFIVVGYFSQLVPWMGITRVVFAYHYFPSLIFLILALAHIFNTCIERGGREGLRTVVGFTAVAGVLFVMFYPVLSGMVVPDKYIKDFLKWFKTWPM